MDVPTVDKVKTHINKVTALFLIALITTSVFAQPNETEHQFIKELESIGKNLPDVDDADAIQDIVGKMFLQCAAFYNAMSIAVADSRPAVAKLIHENANFHLLVGQALLTEPGMPLSSRESFVNAYVETYMLDSVLKYTEVDLEFKEKSCSSDLMQNRGKEVISDLEKNLEQADQ